MEPRKAIIIAEGLVAGVLAHIAIAIVLVVADVLAGRGYFYTPALLGQAVVGGGAGCEIGRSGPLMLAYTSIHLVTLTLFGIFASWIVQRSEERPLLWFGALFAFIFVAWHLTGFVLGIAGPAQECVSHWPIIGAGFAGAIVMAAYLWRAHPRLRRELRGDRYA